MFILIIFSHSACSGKQMFSREDLEEFELSSLNISAQWCLHFSFTLHLNLVTKFLQSISCGPRLTHPLILSHSLFFNLSFPLFHSCNCPFTDSKSCHIHCFSLYFFLFTLYISSFLISLNLRTLSFWECVSVSLCVSTFMNSSRNVLCCRAQ